jgi:hypothetical protein
MSGQPLHLSGSYSITFRVGRKFWCTVTYPATEEADGIGALSVSWSPHAPRRILTRAERRDWRRGLEAMAAEISRQDGVPFEVAEV